MPKRTCSIEGCDNKHQARGWCNNHYRKWLKYGDPTAVYEKTEEHKQKLSKSLLGHAVSDETRNKISNAHRGRKLSPEHLENVRRSNIRLRAGKAQRPETVAKRSGENSANWKDLVGYCQAHRWAYKHIGYTGVCVHCGGAKKTELANISYDYLKDPSDWIELCRQCHAIFDAGNRKAGKVRRVVI